MTAYNNTSYKHPRDRSNQKKTQKKPPKKSRKPNNRTTTIHLRLARLLVSLRASVRSARAALRASNTHCAADIIIGESGGTASRPANNKQASFTTLYLTLNHNMSKSIQHEGGITRGMEMKIQRTIFPFIIHN